LNSNVQKREIIFELMFAIYIRQTN